MRGISNKRFLQAALLVTGLAVCGFTNATLDSRTHQEVGHEALKSALAFATCTRPLIGQVVRAQEAYLYPALMLHTVEEDVTITKAKLMPPETSTLPHPPIPIELAGITKNGREVTKVFHWYSSECGEFRPEFLQNPQARAGYAGTPPRPAPAL